MERQEAINCFIASAESVEEDLKQWEEEGMPSEEVQDKWEYFLDLLQLAEEEGIDKDKLVSQHAQICMMAFIKLEPKLAKTIVG